ncbi:MAG: GH3 auxin-responsive promoter family protein [Rhodospirillales bacterium]
MPRSGPLAPAFDGAKSALASVSLKCLAWKPHQRLMKASENPEAAQQDVLRRIMAKNAETAFGKEHGFSAIKSAADFRSAVPVQSYEDLRPYIERQELTGEPRLTAEKPVYYNRTSGTLGQPKNIPITPSGMANLGAHQKIAALAQSRIPGIYKGKLFAVTGQTVEGHMPGGAPCGAASGLFYQNQRRILGGRCVIPPELAGVEDYDARYLAMAALALCSGDVTFAATANPSTFVKLLSIINEKSGALLEILASGGPIPGVPEAAVSKDDLTAAPERIKALEAALARGKDLAYADIWPGLKGVATWTGGSCGLPLDILKPSFPSGCRIIEVGYLASEMRGTLNIDAQHNTCVPVISDIYYEFAERGAWEDGQAEFLSAHELEQNKEYYVFVTTQDGLYRYDMNDIVKVTGAVNAAPALGFVQKGKGATNITGEKLYESQVLEAARKTFADHGAAWNFFIMLADSAAAAYTLYVESPDPAAAGETAAQSLDKNLRALNIEYDSKRASGRLAPTNAVRLRRGTGENYRTNRVEAGQRDAQFKYLHLQYTHECPFPFHEWAFGN